jgi:hypothetical protein
LVSPPMQECLFSDINLAGCTFNIRITLVSQHIVSMH